MVNQLLAAELYLKCLAVIDNGSHPFVHRLVDLFDDLRPRTREILEELYRAAISTVDYSSNALAITELRPMLEAVGNAYVELRFQHHPETGTTFQVWAAMCLGVFEETILERRPDLQT